MKNLFFFAFLGVVITLSSCRKEDPCDSVSCYNGGICRSGFCDCPPGFSGTNCQDQDLCYNVTCYNGGYCSNGQCNCPTGYTGSDCSIALMPTSMTITKIEVTGYPMTQSSGAGWDISDGPDVFITINSGTTSNQNDYVSGNIQNVSGGKLTYSADFPRTIPTPSNYWSIAVWDYDATSANDFMAGIYFIPNNYRSGFPSSFSVNASSSNLSFKFFVTWNF